MRISIKNRHIRYNHINKIIKKCYNQKRNPKCQLSSNPYSNPKLLSINQWSLQSRAFRRVEVPVVVFQLVVLLMTLALETLVGIQRRQHQPHCHWNLPTHFLILGLLIILLWFLTPLMSIWRIRRWWWGPSTCSRWFWPGPIPLLLALFPALCWASPTLFTRVLSTAAFFSLFPLATRRWRTWICAGWTKKFI